MLNLKLKQFQNLIHKLLPNLKHKKHKDQGLTWSSSVVTGVTYSIPILSEMPLFFDCRAANVTL